MENKQVEENKSKGISLSKFIRSVSNDLNFGEMWSMIGVRGTIWKTIPKKQRKKYWGIIGLSVLKGFTDGFGSPWLLGNLSNINDIGSIGLKNPVMMFGSGYIGGTFLSDCFSIGSESITNSMFDEITVKLIKDNFLEYMQKDKEFFNNISISTYNKNVNYCIKAVQGSLQSLSNIITGISSMGSSFVNICLKNTGIAFSLVILSFILFLREKHNLKTIRKFKKNAREEDQKFGNSISNFMNVVEYVQRTLLGFQTASEEIEKSSQDFINANNTQYKVRSKKKIEKAITNLLVRSGAFIGLIAIGKITTGELISALNSIAVFKKNADNFTRYFVELNEHLQDYKDAMEIIKTPSKIIDKNDAIDLTEKLKGKAPIIEFKNVSYSYTDKQGKEKEVLKNLNLEIKAGEKIAIVGENGSGKTTMLSLLERAYDLKENSGSIEIDGVNIKDVKVKSLRQNIGYVPSNIELLPGKSIVENLGFGLGDVSKEDVAFTLARLSFTKNIDIDNENVINNSANKGLSDGQKKKLCLARIFLLKSPIAVFDEPTNALDEESVNTITNAMVEHCKDKTGILISHDKKVAEKFADRIVKLENGKISEIIELKRNKQGEIINKNIEYMYDSKVNQKILNKLTENINSK